MSVTPLGLATAATTSTKIQNDTENKIPSSEIDAASAATVQKLLATEHDRNTGIWADEGNFICGVDKVSIDTTDALFYFRKAFQFDFNNAVLALLPAQNVKLDDFFPLVGILADTQFFLIAEETALGEAIYKIENSKPAFNDNSKTFVSRFFFRKSLGVNGEIDPLTYIFQPFLLGTDDLLRTEISNVIHQGLAVSGIAGQLKFSLSSGFRYTESLNFRNDRKNPNILEYVAESPMKHIEVSPAELDVPVLPITNELIDPTTWYNGAILAAVPGNNWGIHLIFKTPLDNQGTIRPQEIYGANNPPTATQASSYLPNLAGVPSGSVFLSAWAIKAEAVDLTDVATAFEVDLPRIFSIA